LETDVKKIVFIYQMSPHILFFIIFGLTSIKIVT